MINTLLFVLGIIILIVLILDIIFTCFSPSGAGVFTARSINWIWKMLSFFAGNRGESKFLNFAGPIITSTTLAVWIVLLWAGNTLIFQFEENSVLNSTTNEPTTPVEKIFYVGYVLSTMGLGDYKPSVGFWQVFTSIISFAGLVIVTIGISYFVPVLQNETERRKLSIYIASMGDSAEDILLNFYDSKDFKNLDSHITVLAEQIILIGEMHLAYPVLHYFHNSNKRKDLSVNLVNLDEALTILITFVPKELWPPENQIHFLRKTVSTYLGTLHEAFIHPANEVPPIPDVSKLKSRGISVINDNEKIQTNYNSIEERRKLLRGLLDIGNWNWDDVAESRFTPQLNTTGKEEEY